MLSQICYYWKKMMLKCLCIDVDNVIEPIVLDKD
jgi:hypothetical protein